MDDLWRFNLLEDRDSQILRCLTKISSPYQDHFFVLCCYETFLLFFLTNSIFQIVDPDCQRQREEVSGKIFRGWSPSGMLGRLV